MTVRPMRVAEVLGGVATLRRSIRTVDELRQVVEAGLPVASLEKAVRRVAADAAEASELKYRIVPKTTLQRRGTRLNLEESQRLERLARMTALAEDVWEDTALAHEFLRSVQPQLGGARPVDLARTDLGTRQVEELLFKLEYSLPV